MNTRDTNVSPSIGTVRNLVLKLAPPLVHRGLNVAVRSDGVVEIRNPGHTRMVQPIVVREQKDGLWWHWQWSGPTRDALPEYEPMVPVNDVEEAARRIANVLYVGKTTGTER